MKYRIKKLRSVENPYHENSNFGESKEWHVGMFVKEPQVGERFNLYPLDFRGGGISTSPVVDIIDENTFETLNSVYYYEKYN